MATSDTGAPTEREPLTAEQTLALIDGQRAKVDAELEVAPSRLYAAWGVAWLVGFAGLYVTAGADPLLNVSRGAAFAVFFLLLIAAMAFTAGHVARATRGLRGVSATTGAMYFWSWALSFAALPLIISSVERLGAPPAAVDLLWTTVPGLLVGVHYMMAGAMWQDRHGFGLGAWVLISTCLGALAGLPGAYLVMSLAGGGGFLLAALWSAARRRAAEGSTGCGRTL